MNTRDEIKNYLVQGVPQEAVARALGVDPSYVSQLMADEDFAGSVQEARMVAAATDSGVDAKIRKGEESALDRVIAKLPMANMQQALQVFRVLNVAKLRKDSIMPQQQQSTGTVVEIYLPSAMVPQYVKNHKSEIVEVEGKTMISAGVKQLERMHAAATAPGITEQRALAMVEMIGESRENREGNATLGSSIGGNGGSTGAGGSGNSRIPRKDLAELLAQL